MTFALVDVNNFYVSCERVFNPALLNRPVVVLSNNDGCAISRSNEAKAMGIKMGAPYFQIEKELRKAGGVALSSNYSLYADLSNRVMSLLGKFSPDQEIYSIDECFLGMSGFKELTRIGQEIRHTILRGVGLPVCAGFGPTKTLAKLANHVAKKRPEWNGVCDLTSLTPTEQDAVVGDIEVGEVWGVGRRIAARLADMGISTVRQLREANPTHIRQSFSVVQERTVMELRGVSCLALEEVAPPKKQIMVSRSFGSPVFELDDLQQAVGAFASRAAEKLRSQASAAGAVVVFIQTSPFREQDPQYSRSLTVPLSTATDDTLRLTRAALVGLKRIYQPGYAFAKAGVMLRELVDRDKVHGDLFSVSESPKSDALMAALDRVNSRFGKKALVTGVAAGGENGVWKMRQGNKSPNFTTRWDELLRLR